MYLCVRADGHLTSQLHEQTSALQSPFINPDRRQFIYRERAGFKVGTSVRHEDFVIGASAHAT